LLAVDTLYNTALVLPFIATLEELALPPSPSSEFFEAGTMGGFGATLTLVVCELRDEEVLRTFLEGWLALGGWEIWRVGGNVEGGLNTDVGWKQEDETKSLPFIDGPFVVWAGWKTGNP
jgi:hypothetical protein